MNLYCDRCGRSITATYYHLLTGEYICGDCITRDEFCDELTEDDVLYNIQSRIKNLDDARENRI